MAGACAASCRRILDLCTNIFTRSIRGIQIADIHKWMVGRERVWPYSNEKGRTLTTFCRDFENILFRNRE